MPKADNPYDGFRGEPGSPTVGGWTIFPTALSEMMVKYLGSCHDMSGYRKADLKEKLNSNKPILAWVVGLGWSVHAICLTGYNADGFYYNDPWTGEKDVFIEYDEFYEIWNKPLYDRTLDQTYEPRIAMSYYDSELSEIEARTALLRWVISHPFQFESQLLPEIEECTVNGEGYFQFQLSITRFGNIESNIEILVSRTTGEIFHSLDNNIFERLNYWYRFNYAVGIDWVSEILFDSIPVRALLDLSNDDVLLIFGKQDNQNNGHCRYPDIGISFYFPDAYSDIYIYMTSGACMLNGTSLEIDKDGLVRLLGNPVKEEYMGPDYTLMFELPFFRLNAAMDSPEDTANSIIVYRM
jgi:hypothetical protein